MQTIIHTSQVWIAANWLFVVIAVAYLLLQYIYGKRSQVDAWCEQQPRLAGLVKIIRGVLPDPWLFVQGVTLLLKGRLPLAYSSLVDKIIKALTASTAALILLGCGGSLHSQVEKVIVFEQQVHSYQQQLLVVAQSAIVMLPADKQAQALQQLQDANGKLTLALDAKDAALQAALDASDASGLDVSKLVADIVAAVNAIVTVVNSFGADPRQTQEVGARLIVAKTRAVAQ